MGAPDSPRHVDWSRFAGDYAVSAVTNGTGIATIGVAGDQCNCCDRRRVIIAAITEAGLEVGVGLPLDTALGVADAIVAAVLRAQGAGPIIVGKPS
jgi:hypothetical protein